MSKTAAPARPWLVLLGLALGVCVTNGFARFAYGLLLPAMRADMGWTYAQSGWLNTANALGYVAGALGTLALVHRVTPARLFGAGVVLTAISLLANGLVTSVPALSAWRVAAGLFGAMSFVSGGALSAALFPGDARRTALAIAFYFGFGGGLGIVLAGLGLPLMLAQTGPGGWPWGWIGIGIFSLAVTPFCLWAARQLRPATGRPPPRIVVPARPMLGAYAGYAAFGMGYIVYLTFLAAWMTDRDVPAAQIASVWVLMGLAITASPFLWRGVFARFAGGAPMALILSGLAAGTALPLLWPGGAGPWVSAMIFGACVFMSPGAVTNFVRQNLAQDSWSAAISQFTVVFAIAQTISPIAAGALGDLTGDIGTGLAAAAGVLAMGAALALTQRPLPATSGAQRA
jgi:MFS family permease